MNQNQMPNNMNQNNIDGVNTPITPSTNPVQPIAEVKVEATSNNTTDQTNQVPVNQTTGTSGGSSNEPPKSSNISTVLVILLFIFLFAFVMGMPYIREFMNNLKDDTGLSEIEQAAREEEEKQKQEEESKKPTPTPEDQKTKELVCTSQSSVVGNYTVVETQKFYYNSKNKILSSKLISNYTFSVTDDTYNNLVQRCDEDSLKYLTHSGYTMACSYGDSKIEISHEFDLKTFKPIVDGTTNIQANANYQQDLSKLKADLANKGYTCE